MWLRELARCERAVDNYATGDHVLDRGMSVSEAQAAVAEEREARGRANQAKLMAASTLAKRVKVVRELLTDLWERLADRPAVRLMNLPVDPRTRSQEELDVQVGRCVEESLERQKRLATAEVDAGAHPEIIHPELTFTEIELRRHQIAAAQAAAVED